MKTGVAFGVFVLFCTAARALTVDGPLELRARANPGAVGRVHPAPSLVTAVRHGRLRLDYLEHEDIVTEGPVQMRGGVADRLGGPRPYVAMQLVYYRTPSYNSTVRRGQAGVGVHFVTGAEISNDRYFQVEVRHVFVDMRNSPSLEDRTNVMMGFRY